MLLRERMLAPSGGCSDHTQVLHSRAACWVLLEPVPVVISLVLRAVAVLFKEPCS